MAKAYIGSKNKVKVAAVIKVFTDYNVIPCDALSLIGNQPLSDEETITGAYNRAVNLPRDGLRIGLEAGVEFHNNILFLVNWGVLIDENDNTYYAGGTRIPLPDFIKEKIIFEKMELADVIDEYTQLNDIRSHQGAIGILTAGKVQREDIFMHIASLLYGQYLYKKRGN